MLKREELSFKKGAIHGFPIALGYFSVSLAFGMIALTKGLPLWAPIITSITNFTGTGQFVGIDLIASTAALYEIALALLVINARYVLMSMSLSQRLSKNITLWQRFIIAFGNTDEVFAVAMSQGQALNMKYMMGIILCSFFGWVGGTVFGTLLSSIVPASITSAMGIMLYAMFIAIIIPPSKGNKAVTITIIIAIILSCAFKFIPYINKISSSFAVIISGVVAAITASILFPLKASEEDE